MPSKIAADDEEAPRRILGLRPVMWALIALVPLAWLGTKAYDRAKLDVYPAPGDSVPGAVGLALCTADGPRMWSQPDLDPGESLENAAHELTHIEQMKAVGNCRKWKWRVSGDRMLHFRYEAEAYCVHARFSWWRAGKVPDPEHTVRFIAHHLTSSPQYPRFHGIPQPEAEAVVREECTDPHRFPHEARLREEAVQKGLGPGTGSTS